MDKIYNMKFHEKLNLQDGTLIIRVPGGWIYRFWERVVVGGGRDNYIINSVFVPYCAELKPISENVV